MILKSFSSSFNKAYILNTAQKLTFSLCIKITLAFYSHGNNSAQVPLHDPFQLFSMYKFYRLPKPLIFMEEN